jgi:DNA modification methylase
MKREKMNDNIIGLGDSEVLLKELPSESVHLIFTSPPYFNARPEYSQYDDYQTYLDKMRHIFIDCHRVLSEGRYFVINSSPVLTPRSKRNKMSRRFAIPFDFHHIITKIGFDFIDDIIWLKPEGAGCGRGRNFARYRTPLHYKTVPITEYVMVYRKHTERLLSRNIRHHPDPSAVERSKIPDGYEKTNVWFINPVHHSQHPAVFPFVLAERIIRHYSIEGDLVLDPFAGSGTVGVAALTHHRRFILFEQEPEYVKLMCRNWHLTASPIHFLNCESFRYKGLL